MGVFQIKRGLVPFQKLCLKSLKIKFTQSFSTLFTYSIYHYNHSSSTAFGSGLTLWCIQTKPEISCVYLRRSRRRKTHNLLLFTRSLSNADICDDGRISALIGFRDLTPCKYFQRVQIFQRPTQN